jgi:serine/threonine protein phosphatase PrpC
MPVVSISHVGKVRKNNEDSLLVKEPKLYAVADGMGGYKAGEVASKAALDALEQESANFDGKLGSALIIAIKKAMVAVNTKVYELATSKAEYEGMGTTLTGVYLPGHNEAYVFNVGDSRLYLLRGGKLSQITKDHSLVAKMVEQGDITPQEAFDHPQRNILLKGIGVDRAVTGDVFVLKVQPSDTLLLCSDGLSDMLRDAEMEEIFKQNDLMAQSDALLQHALDKGGRDNISFIILSLIDNEEVDRDDR